MTASPQAFVSRAEQIFLRPGRQYPWADVIRGAKVLNCHGETRVIPAVGTNTFRGFHRLDKSAEGPQETFVSFFMSEKRNLITALDKVKTSDSLHELACRIQKKLIQRLGNIRPEQLRSFNKVRKPVDLYLEHLVSMAEELAHLRSILIPLIFLPLDSWILDHQGIFSESELLGLGLSRGLSFGDVTAESTYLALQRLAQSKACAITAKLNTRFHPIYYDLFWNNRFKNWGSNLFETNP